MEARFVENPFFEKELVRMAEVRSHLRDAAEAIAGVAANNVHGDTGGYESSLSVEEFGRGTPKGYRVVARTPYASLLEFGGRFMRAQYPLRNAVEACGLKFKRKGA